MQLQLRVSWELRKREYQDREFVMREVELRFVGMVVLNEADTLMKLQQIKVAVLK